MKSHNKRKQKKRIKKEGSRWIEKVLFLFVSGLSVIFIGSVFLALRKMKKLEVVGYENLPDGGNMILAPNHPSMIETVLIPIMPLFKSWQSFKCFLRNPFELAPWSTPDEWWLKLIPLLKYLHCIPVKNQRVDVASLNIATDILKHNGIIVLFVEGGRTGKRKGKRHFFFSKKDEKRMIRKPRFGIGSMQMTVQPKVIPIWIDGVKDIWPIGQALPNLFGNKKITIYIGEEIDFTFAKGLEYSKRITSVIAEVVAREILKVSDFK